MGNCILRETMLKVVLLHILLNFVDCKGDDGLGWLFTTEDLIDAEPPKPGTPVSAPLARQNPRDLRIPAEFMAPVINANTYDAPSDNLRVCPNDRVCLKGQYCDHHYEICRDKVPIGHPCRRDEMCQPGNDCMFGYCQQRVKRGHEGARCRSDVDCGSGMCCAPRHGQRVCQRLLQEGDKCYVPEGGLEYAMNGLCPCGSGLVCRSSTTTGGSNGSSRPMLGQGFVPAFPPPLLLALEGVRCVVMA